MAGELEAIPEPTREGGFAELGEEPMLIGRTQAKDLWAGGLSCWWKGHYGGETGWPGKRRRLAGPKSIE